MKTLYKILGVFALIAALMATYYTGYLDFQPAYGLFGESTEPTYVIGVSSIVAYIIFTLSSVWIINKKSIFRQNKLVYTISLLFIFSALIGDWLRTF